MPESHLLKLACRYGGKLRSNPQRRAAPYWKRHHWTVKSFDAIWGVIADRYAMNRKKVCVSASSLMAWDHNMRPWPLFTGSFGRALPSARATAQRPWSWQRKRAAAAYTWTEGV